MSDTDNPLKTLITDFSEAFAAWLLNRPVQWVRPLNVEFPAHPVQSDLLFQVMDEQGEELLLHYELQGRRSHQPMPYRQLEYMSQITIREIPWPLGPNAPRLHSVVLYIGRGAGRDDRGDYAVYGPEGAVTLQWRYQPVRLWEMTAENLLQLEQPALLALIGLTQLQQPEQELPQALTRIRAVADDEQRQRLLAAMVSLLPTEEVIQMVERLLEESENLLLDTPYLRRMREKGREEGLQEGVQIGLEKGLQAVREAILEAVVRKFDPSVAEYRELEKGLARLHQPDRLQEILLALFEAVDVMAVLALVKEMDKE
jgi:predicted transposase YdaD